jgi:ferritin
MSINDKVQAALNNQINLELSAFYTYLSAAAHLEASNFPGMAAWMRHHAQEEMEHAMKIYDYLHDRRGRVRLLGIAEPHHQWESTISVFEAALHHEEKVTASIHALVQLAREERDPSTESFLRWFVDEQVEEEKVVDEVLQRLKLVGDFGPGLYMVDRELAASGSHGGEEEEAGGEYAS